MLFVVGCGASKSERNVCFLECEDGLPAARLRNGGSLITKLKMHRAAAAKGGPLPTTAEAPVFMAQGQTDRAPLTVYRRKNAASHGLSVYQRLAGAFGDPRVKMRGRFRRLSLLC